ncbi:family 43 glycosylhydrolase [Paenibacillus soyae]|uniref:Family 43 glycosylhydrolase n=1 Tax=Paenibacillus soyae TaxID=2969249 RepID=A0A9X2MR33_9BACL|nr:family 43 glycosylhydrolase [Paenibacillus soyae]MCR2802302.1 family 43 glycosylhydrolase [Paenibacillus soyae]
MRTTSMKACEIRLKAGEALNLPKLVEVELEGGLMEKYPVEWEPVEPSLLGRAGTFTVEGAIIADEYPNPLVPNRADPHVYKHTDGYYYFTGSVPEYDRLALRRSRTVAGLSEAEETVIWTKHETGEMGNHIWAPELHYIDGKWYIYFAAGTAENKWAIRPYVLECEDENPLTGTWTEKGRIELPVESFSLDATTFEHRGRRYLAWAQIIEESCLYIARMDSPWSIATEPVKISAPEYDWEIQLHRVNEGPAVLKRNGKVFMAYSASGTDHRYCMGLLTADDASDLLDPASWSKSREPVFASSEAASEYGPGHNSFTVSEDGSADLLVYHSRPYKEIEGEPLYDPNRHARVQRVLWKPDGTPFFATPGWKLDPAGNTAKAKVTIE